MSESPVRVTFGDRPITCAEVAEDGRRIKAERARLKRADRLLRWTAKLAMWAAGFARQRHVTPRMVRRRKGVPLDGRRVRVRRVAGC